MRRCSTAGSATRTSSVSVIALGSWLTYSRRRRARADRGVHAAAFDAGITFFDTANVYGRGAAEARLGRDPRATTRATRTCSPRRSTSRCPRATAGCRASRSTSRSTPRWRGCRPTTSTSTSATATTTHAPLEETMGALTEVVEAGKARYIGFSEWPSEQIEAALDLPGVAKFVSSQPQYSMLWRAPEAEVIPLCERQRDLADRLVAARPGRADRQVPPGEAPPPDSRAASRDDEPLHRPVAHATRCSRRSQRCGRSPSEAGLTMSQLALAWVLRQAERRGGDHRRVAARAGARERARRRRRAQRRHARGDRRGARARRPLNSDRPAAWQPPPAEKVKGFAVGPPSASARSQNSGGVVSSGSIRQPPSGAAVACQSSSKPSSGVGR